MALTCKTSLSGLNTGDYIWCKYTASSGSVGSFSDLATKVDADVASSLIPTTPTTTANGYFKLICVGEDYLGRKKLVADRILHHTISWDKLNIAGIATRSGLSTSFTSGGTVTLNPNKSTMTLSEGNMRASGGGYVYNRTLATEGKSAGKWYYEAYIESISQFSGVGVATSNVNLNAQGGKYSVDYWYSPAQPIAQFNVSDDSGVSNNYWLSGTTPMSSGCYLGVAYDADTKTVKFYINGLLQHTYTINMPNGQTLYPTAMSWASTTAVKFNFGATAFNYPAPSGYSSWEQPAINFFPNHTISCRLLTGGVNASDKSNEWDKIIVESNLDGKITAGDNAIWNWSSTTESWTSSTSTSAGSRVGRGYSGAVADYYAQPSSGENATFGFRPVFIIGSVTFNKFLLLDGTNIYKVVAGIRSLVGTTPVTEANFISDGMDDVGGITSTHISDLTTPKILLYKPV
jgi:hypothetical protein